MTRVLAAILAALVAAVSSPAFAQSLIVKKQTFELPSYTTVGGATIKTVKIGWEAAGTLNADKSNAILITHYFTGTSHAFGKYAESDKTAGYWDYLIGPGKVIDTDKYYVLSSDTLVNLNVKLPTVVDHGAGQHQSRHRQALRHELSGGDDAGLRQRAEGADRKPRHQEAQSRGRRLDGLAAGLSVGGELSRQRRAHRRHCRRAARRRLSHRLARRLVGADQARSEMERRRLLRQGPAGRGLEARAQAHHLAGRASRNGRRRPSAPSPPIRQSRRRRPWTTSSRSKRRWKPSPPRAHRWAMPTRCFIWPRPTSS